MTSIAAIVLQAVLIGLQDPPAAGIVKGTVEFFGTAPKPKMIPILEQHQAAVGAEKIPDESVVLGPGGALKNVFVYVKGGLKKDGAWPAPREATLKIQKGRFTSRVIGLQTGGKLTLLNQNEPGHNFCPHGKAVVNREFSVSLAEGASWSVTLEKREFMIPVHDDVHPWMTAYICVVDHPFFAVTDDRGRFEIKDLPPGEYELEALHETLGKRTEKVTLKEKEGASVRLSFKAP